MFRSVLSARSRADQPLPLPELTALEVAQQRHEARMERVNAEVVATAGAPLVPVPICARACEPGVLSDFLLEIGVDPFGRWNMCYYAADRRAAQLLDTHVYDRAFERLHDAPMAAVIEKLQRSWVMFRACEPEADARKIRNYCETLKFLLEQAGDKVERTMFAGKKNLWQPMMGDRDAPRAA